MQQLSRGAIQATPDFVPLFPDPHVLTILGNYWPRQYDFSMFRKERKFVETGPDVQVLVETEYPNCPGGAAPRGELVLLHGLEGSGEAGYIITLAHGALMAGYIVHRFHMRTCGGTEHLCQTLYHAGLTDDLLSFLHQNHSAKQDEGRKLPCFLVGFSLGGNVALKAVAEAGSHYVAGVATVSAAIDLKACAQALDHPRNWLYANRFVARMKARIMRTGRYEAAELKPCKTVYEIDDRITAPSFGFGTAERYYATQSAMDYIPRIDLPVLMISAQDDSLVPFEMYRDHRVLGNENVEVLAPAHGGHLGFVSRHAPRWWADAKILNWINNQGR